MSKKVDLLNQLVADLSVAFVKFHNLHWNVKGERFKEVHEYAEELYDQLNEHYDDVAERLKMLGEFPPASQKANLEITKIKELGNEELPTIKVYEVLLEDLKYLLSLVTDARNTADEENDFATVDMLEDIAGGFAKEIWFVSQALK